MYKTIPLFTCILLFILLGCNSLVNQQYNPYDTKEEVIETQKETETKEIIEIENTSTYTDPNQEFSLSYPAEWQVYEISSELDTLYIIGFSPKDLAETYANENDATIQVRIYANPDKLTLSEYFKAIPETVYFQVNDLELPEEYEEIQVAGKSAIFLDKAGFYYPRALILIPYEDKIYEIVTMGSTENNPEFDLLLDSFQLQ